MGHFSQRCMLSYLAITGGTPIRVVPLVSDPWSNEWHVRAPPIRAVYDDYGGIKNIHEGDAGVLDLWRRGLDIDVVERGDSACARVGMTVEQYLASMKSGQIFVRTDHKNFWRRSVDRPLMAVEEEERKKREASTPSARHVEKLVAEGGFDTKRIRVDEPTKHLVRVQWDWMAGGNSYGKGATVLAEVEKMVRDKTTYACVLTAPHNGSSKNDVVLLVVASPTNHHHAGPDWGDSNDGAEHTLSVRWAMIREDAWNAVARLPHNEYVEYDRYRWYGLPELRQSVRQAWAQYLERVKDGAKRFGGLQQDGEYYFGDFDLPADCGIDCRASVLFHDKTVSTLALRQHLQILMALGKTPSEDTFDSLADYVSISHHMLFDRRVWEPTYNIGPQDAEWAEQIRYKRTILRLAECIARKRLSDYGSEQLLSAPATVAAGLKHEREKATRRRRAARKKAK